MFYCHIQCVIQHRSSWIVSFGLFKLHFSIASSTPSSFVSVLLPPPPSISPTLCHCLAHPLAYSRLGDTIFARAFVALSATEWLLIMRGDVCGGDGTEKEDRGEAGCHSEPKCQNWSCDRACQVTNLGHFCTWSVFYFLFLNSQL